MRGPYEAGATPGQPAPWAEPPPPLPTPSMPGQGMPEIVPGPAPLPAYQASPAQPPARAAKADPMIGFLGDVVRTGRWHAPRKINTLLFLGDVKLDLREELQPGETLVVECWSLMGDVKVAVPPGTEIVISGGTLMGDVKTESDQAQPAPRTGARLEIRGYTFMGDVKVREMGPVVGKPPRGWRWLTRRG